MAKTFKLMAGMKPQVRDILWAYERNKDMKKAVDDMEELFDQVWRIAIAKKQD